MILLLDTNIIVDIISMREGYSDSLNLIRYCEIGIVKGYVTATTVTDLMYILRKHIEPGGVREAVHTLLYIVDVVSVLKRDIVSAFKSIINDYEDAIQPICAERIKADYIVTHNLKDFKNSILPAISPNDILRIIANGTKLYRQ